MKKRSKEEWYELITKCGRSKQTQTEWCKLNNINIYTFRNAKRRFEKTRKEDKKESDDQSKEKDMERIKWLSVPMEDKPSEEDGKLTVKVGKFEILAEAGFNKSIFINVCEVLMNLC